MINLYHKGELFECLISIEDLDKFLTHKYKWCIGWHKHSKKYYIRSTIYLGVSNGKIKNELVYLHKYIINAKNEDLVDHINGNTLDNRRCNLRIISHADNLKNRVGLNSNNTSGYRNVSWVKNDQVWRVQLYVNGKNLQLGDFDDVHEAGKFAKKMRKKYYGEFEGAG